MKANVSPFQKSSPQQPPRVDNAVILSLRSCVGAAEGSSTLTGPPCPERYGEPSGGSGSRTGCAPLSPQLPAGPWLRPRSLLPRQQHPSEWRRAPIEPPLFPGGSGLGFRPPCPLCPRPRSLRGPAACGPGRRRPEGSRGTRSAPRGAGGGAGWRAPGEAGGGRRPPPTPTRTPPPPTPTLLGAPARARGPAAGGTHHLPSRLGQRRAGDLGHGSCLGRGWWGAGVGVGGRPPT
ncbi:protein enabled-like [Oryctolagus cuniculus]|uniref:protein enabled-like n=1 Tax=Oryctolagus cuniculus TaxID=9986 RepID=UPI003879AACD